ncbi:MAG TPA: hypothetical protein IGS53_07550 [Leptolyngbyaceae cyanobacterium M33_DOE_097]|uniref:Uncharacterized protein n=1 Tax=Oscillatoriales cyanobacterium SpSt-418 TaxID=2282169 RepID=A0A7C3KIW1_9CYAN|nr:hypothetical protein [Leptolyngbyaceae cyanobacterium M33_DOE_097]
MRPQDSTWQGCFGYWQNLFICENLLPLGHASWLGFTTQGRGLLACDVAISDTGAVDWSEDVVEYSTRFVPEHEIPAYLQTLKLDRALIAPLLDTVQTYHPDQDIVLLIHENGQVNINLLRHLTISPAECYQQVQRRWSEFQLDQV